MTSRHEGRASFNWSDETVNQAHVQHLERVTELSFVERYKRRSHQLMNLQEGHRVLDVGCGLGDDVMALVAQVGATGQVIGIDQSTTMIEQATARQGIQGRPVEFHVMDARNMTFDDNSFDAVRSDRVLQHIPDVHLAIKEMIRVLKPGGIIVLNETDWGTLTLDVSNRDVFRKIKAHHEDTSIRNGWMGRNTIGYLADGQVENIATLGETAFFRDYDFTKRWGVWHGAVQSAKDAGIITADEANQHLQDLDTRAEAGKHMLTLTIFTVSATKTASR